MAAANQLTEGQIAVFKEAFSFCDTDGDGIITVAEFCAMVGRMLTEVDLEPTTRIQAAAALRQVQGDDGVRWGHLDFPAFLSLMAGKLMDAGPPCHPEENAPRPSRPSTYSRPFVPTDDDGNMAIDGDGDRAMDDDGDSRAALASK